MLGFVRSAKVATSKSGSKYLQISLIQEDLSLLYLHIWNSSDVKRVLFKILKVEDTVLHEFSGIKSCSISNLTIEEPTGKWLTYVPSIPTLEEWECQFAQCNDQALSYQAAKFYDAYSKFPAATSHHHAYPGGLLKHTYEIMLMCNAIFSSLPCECNRSMLGWAILYHDYGKLEEYTCSGEVTSAMSLLGHPYIGAAYLREVLQGLNYSQEFIQRAVHCVLSHHEFKEWGSPVEPCIPEAVVLSMLDRISGYCTELSGLVPGERFQNTVRQ